jgi:hypothetical protein
VVQITSWETTRKLGEQGVWFMEDSYTNMSSFNIGLLAVSILVLGGTDEPVEFSPGSGVGALQ